MSLPTLLIKGNLRAHSGLGQADLDEWKPLDYIIDWFTQRANKVGPEARVLVLKSETASGKSTALPPEMYRKLVRGQPRGIICTQPRVATAVENVIEMMKHNADVLRLGDTIGWSTKHNKFRPVNVGLLSATIGTLAQLLRSSTDEDIMAKYRYIMIDETHERDLQTDMTIAALRALLARNVASPDCPYVVLMSATFEPDSLLRYFGVPAATNFIWCGGQTAHIEEMWDWNDGRVVNDYTRAAAAVVERILRDGADDDPKRADVLIFLPGAAEFKACADRLNALNRTEAEAGRPVFSLLQIDGPAFQTQNRDFMLTVRVPTGEHEVTFEGASSKKYRPNRRVILATNVAETGLTLENLKYVIDSGYNREIEYNPVLDIHALVTKPAPISRIRQRRGRAGRKFPGVFYPLYPRYIYDRLPTSQFPQILTEDVSTIYLDIMAEQLRGGHAFDPYAVNMVDPPGPDATKAALIKLYALGFVSLGARYNVDIAADPIKMTTRMEDVSWGDDTAATPATRSLGITPLGHIARALSGVSVESARMILSSYAWGANTLDVITIAAYLALEPKSFAGVGADSMRALVDWAAVYKRGLPQLDSGRGSLSTLVKLRLLIADEFINGVVLFDAIKSVLSSGALKASLSALHKWCDKCGLSYRACLDFVRARDEIIEQMITVGLRLNDAPTLSSCTETTLTNTVARLKYCIYDGYRCNVITMTDGKYAVAHSNTPIITPKLFRDDETARSSEFTWAGTAMPRQCLYRSLSLKYNRATFAFDVRADDISVMDGWVALDDGWMG